MSLSRRSEIAAEAVGPTIVAGEILVEIMATERGMGFLEPLTLVGPYPSGAPAIFIDQVARLGGGAGLIGCVGRDDFGTLNLERLKRDGVDVSAVDVSDRFPTGCAFVRYRPDGGRDFVYNIAESAAGQIHLTTAARLLADKAGHLHIMGSTLSVAGLREIVTYAVQAVRARGGSTSFDPNMRKELIDGADGALFSALVDDADLLLPSGDELLAAAGVDDERQAVAALFARGVGAVDQLLAHIRVEGGRAAARPHRPHGIGDNFLQPRYRQGRAHDVQVAGTVRQSPRFWCEADLPLSLIHI